MKKGLVIKTYGDPEITGAIVAALVPTQTVSAAREHYKRDKRITADTPFRMWTS